MSRRVLVLADLYPPHFAPRIYSMVMQWQRRGWYVEVATEEIVQWNKSAHGLIFQDEEDKCPVHRIPLRKKYTLRESLQELFFFSKTRHFQEEIEKRLEIASFDLIIGFSYRTFPLSAVARLAKKYRKPCVMDCRDIVEQYPDYKFLPISEENPPLWKKFCLIFLRNIFIRQRNNFLAQADAITTVSPWHKEQLEQYFPHKPIQLFYNGFDKDVFIPDHPTTDRFQIVFTGRLLSLEHGDPQMLFEALASDALSPIVSSGSLEVHWYVDKHSEEILRKRIQELPQEVQEIQRFFSMVPFREVPNVLSIASIVLLLAQPKGTKGIVSTKIFEAMAMRKPILMVQSDNAIRSMILTQAKAGCAVQSIQDIIDLIREHYTLWKEKGYTYAEELNVHYVNSFSRSDIAENYALFLERIIDCRRENDTKQ